MSYRRLFSNSLSRAPLLAASLSASVVAYSVQKNQSFISFADAVNLSKEANENIAKEVEAVIEHVHVDADVKVEETKETKEEEPELLNIEDVKPENLADWIEEHKSCSFCRGFIESPCFDQFRLWSICSTESKKHGKEVSQVCTHYFTPLFNCIRENHEFFDNQVKEQEAQMAAAAEAKAKAEAETKPVSEVPETPVVEATNSSTPSSENVSN